MLDIPITELCHSMQTQFDRYSIVEYSSILATESSLNSCTICMSSYEKSHTLCSV
jgi:hypothetical protein